MIQKIEHREVNFLGRNGYFKAHGVSIMDVDAGTIVAIQPITSKGDIGRMTLEIPRESLPEFIQGLQRFMELKEVQPAKVLIEVGGGLVQCITTEGRVEVYLVDEDNIKEGSNPREAKELYSVQKSNDVAASLERIISYYEIRYGSAKEAV